MKRFISGAWLTIQDKIQRAICTIGLKRKLKKERKARKKYDKLCSKFTLTIDPTKVGLDKYLVQSGSLYRVQFFEAGLSITDGYGNFIEDELTRLRVLKQLVEVK